MTEFDLGHWFGRVWRRFCEWAAGDRVHDFADYLPDALIERFTVECKRVWGCEATAAPFSDRVVGVQAVRVGRQ